jgi:hypothetical protein
MMKSNVLRGSGGLVLFALACSGRSTTKLSTHSPDEGFDTEIRRDESLADAALGSANTSTITSAAITSAYSDAGTPSVDTTSGNSSADVDSSRGQTSAVADAAVPDAASVEPPIIEGRQVLAKGDRLRLESISSNGDWIAYTEYAGERTADSDCEPQLWECHTSVDLKVVASTGGTPTTIAAGLDLAFARFVGDTLFIMRGSKRVPEVLNGLLETAPELLAWRPGDAELSSLGVNVDPGAFRSSKDDRWVSVEVNDVIQDLVPTAELVLIETATLAVRSITVKDRVRGRFTRDSQWLFFGGADDKLDKDWPVERISLVDAEVQTVAQVSDAWWKLSHDGRWLVHREGGMLTRTPAAGGTSQQLTDAFVSAGGKHFDVGQDGKSLSFAYRKNSTWGLYAMPLAGGSMTQLSGGGFGTLLAHYESIVVYSEYDDVDGSLLWAAPVTGGARQPLGSYSNADIESYVLDDKDDALLVRDTTGTIRVLRDITEPPTELVDSGRAARFLRDGRILSLQDSVAVTEPKGEVDGRIFSLLGEGKLTLHGNDGETVIEDAVTGPFELDPQRGAWYATTVHDGDGDSTSLIVDVVP